MGLIMKAGFMNEPDDCQWLRDTALRGVTLPSAYTGFQAFVLQGNEDAPHAVNLYRAQNPDHDDNYFRVVFQPDEPMPVYCIGCEYHGCLDRPLGNLTPVKSMRGV